MKHYNFKKGDLVWWTMGGPAPLPYTREEDFIGIVVNTTETPEDIEVYWFNNQLFSAIASEHLCIADLGNALQK